MTVSTGLDRLAQGEALLDRSARLALLSNRAARDRAGRWPLEVLRAAGYQVSLLLTPEHGLEVAAEAGAVVGHSRLGDLPVFSLYGADLAPVEEALTGVDLIVADLADIGVRYYTYPWTVRETMRLAARHALPLTILDRPNPLGGTVIEGSLPQLDSPVCASLVPIRHGLTLGELSRWNRQTFDLEVELGVVPVTGWEREQRFPATGLPWVPPSPALPNFSAVTLYPGTCLLEGMTMSEGRGTAAPFQQFGSPQLSPGALIEELQGQEALAGATLEPVTFTPQASKWAGVPCAGVRVTVTDADRFQPVRAGLALVGALRAVPDFAFLPSFDKLAGTTEWREHLLAGAAPEEITAGFAAAEGRFRRERTEVLLY